MQSGEGLTQSPPECGCGWGAENYWAGGKLDRQVVVGRGGWGLPTSMVAAAGRLPLLVTSFPQEARGC